MDRWLHKTRRIIIWLAALVVLIHLSGCAIVYSSADVEGRIVDADTGEPVEGAVVIGIWQLESYPIHNHFMEDIIHVSESVSDVDGHYRVEGFTLKFVGHKSGSLYEHDPLILVFVEGYRPTSVVRSERESAGIGPYRKSPFNGRDITVQREAIDSMGSARRWSSFIAGTLEDVTCDDVHRLPSMMELFGRIDPQLKQYYKGIFSWRYKDTVKKCTGSTEKK